MTTVTGLTADRMLAIEAASVVDGDVDASGNLILTKHDGSKINAGSVIGPQGPQGPVGGMLSVVSAKPVLDMGLANQIRAGRQLSPADFANIGLSAPLGLWNLSDLTDASGNGRNLQNKGAVPFTTGINGGANTAALFTGSTAQALYISDTGTNDPFRIKTGSVGCWSRSTKQNTFQELIAKYGTQTSWYIGQEAGNRATTQISVDGSTWIAQVYGATNIADDRWHFTVATFDGSALRIYVDGVFEGITPAAGFPFPSSGPLNIGSAYGDGSTASAAPFFGRIDEAFITADVLTEDQIRNLYCARISHTLGAVPSRVSLNVRRRRKGAPLVASDFPTQPLRLYNFSAGSAGDEGSNNVTLTSTRLGVNQVAGADGTQNNAYYYNGGAGTDFAGTDAGLPSGLAARSFGCWFKAAVQPTSTCMIGWGTYNTAGADILFNNAGVCYSYSGADQVTGIFVCDSNWHFIVVTEDNGALDGVKRKMYVDGKLVGTSLGMTALVLAGANRFRVGAAMDGTIPMTGVVDTAFVCGYALTYEQIATLYAKGTQTLAPTPKNAGDHIEAMDATSLLATFDTLDSQYQIDLGVAA